MYNIGRLCKIWYFPRATLLRTRLYRIDDLCDLWITRITRNIENTVGNRNLFPFWRISWSNLEKIYSYICCCKSIDSTWSESNSNGMRCSTLCPKPRVICVFWECKTIGSIGVDMIWSCTKDKSSSSCNRNFCRLDGLYLLLFTIPTICNDSFCSIRHTRIGIRSPISTTNRSIF